MTPSPLEPLSPSHRLADRFRGTRGILLAVAGYLVLMLLLQGLGGDFLVADTLYALEGGRWALQEHWLTRDWIHDGGKRVVLALWLLLALGTVGLGWHPRGRAVRRPLLVFLASVLASVGLVAAIKYGLPMDCPWSLERYGGTLPYTGLFELRPAGFPHNACFPAAHASAGFAWVALYPFLARVAPRWRAWGLAAGIGLGGLFAAAQELRGAHFLSHDLSSLVLCLAVAFAFDRLFNGRRVA
jgi:membrane-associated PAP2 superfamily phosphatase